MYICTVCQPQTIPKVLSELGIACWSCNGLVVLLFHAKLKSVMIICYYKKMLLI